MNGAQEAPTSQVAAALEQVTASVGLRLEDLVPLFLAGVTVDDLLNYVDAVNTNRLN